MENKTGLTIEQIHTEIEKQALWMGDQPKQKEFIEFYTWRCEPKVRLSINISCSPWPVPELLYMSFTLTNDHIERGDYKYDKAEFSFQDLNFN